MIDLNFKNAIQRSINQPLNRNAGRAVTPPSPKQPLADKVSPLVNPVSTNYGTAVGGNTAGQEQAEKLDAAKMKKEQNNAQMPYNGLYTQMKVGK